MILDLTIFSAIGTASIFILLISSLICFVKK